MELPRLWLLSDARNDTVLEAALKRLPRGSGFLFRHHHLSPPERRDRLDHVAKIVRQRGHLLVIAGEQGQPLRIMAAHNLREIARANRQRADAVLLSPVFPTRSHPGAPCLGVARFRLLAARALVPVIALGGMNPRNALRLGWSRWAAIDGLS